MTVRFYSSLDTGAPVLSGSVYDQLRTILLACLVNGYGSKPAAGWTLVHDVTNGFSLSNGDGVINFVYLSITYVRVYIMEAVTDPSTALAGGVNRRSSIWYDGASTSTRQDQMVQALTYTSNKCWSVVADEKTAILFVGGNTAVADAPASWYEYGQQMYFGRYINNLGFSGAAEFCALSRGQNTGFAIPSQGDCIGSVLRNPRTGLADQGADARYGAGGARSYSMAYKPSIAPVRLTPVRSSLLGYGATISGSTLSTTALPLGTLRGLIFEPELNLCALRTVGALFGKGDVWQTRVTPLVHADGTVWIPLFPYIGDATFFVSLDPLDWE